MALTGCSESTDVAKEVNDAYHNKQAPVPPPDAMKPKGPAFVGQAQSMPIAGGGAPPPGVPEGAKKGPATPGG